MSADWSEITKRVKEANDIVSVVGSYLTLHPRGSIYKSICPFHNDSRPSLDIDPKRQRYRCWSCGAFGDVFKFIMEQEKVDFKEARAILARKANISLDAETSPLDQQRVQLRNCLNWAQAQFKDALFDSAAGEAARIYLGERKFNGETVRDFGLGFAPADGDWLVRLGRDAGLSMEIMVEVGLIAPRTEGRGFYDRFRDRLMFPIRDARGQVVGFGGRILPNSPKADQAPKYYNSAETPLFNKSELLFGLDTARHDAAKTGTLAIVEGYTDVMMAHQMGIGNVVATMGTALNIRHLTQLRRYIPAEVKVILMFDADAGGKTGIDRALELFISQELELQVATLPNGLDPYDVFLQPGGKQIFLSCIEQAVDALDFKMKDLFRSTRVDTVEGKRKAADDLLRTLAQAPDASDSRTRMKYDLFLQRISQRLGLLPLNVSGRLQELRAEFRSRVKTAVPAAASASAYVSADDPDGSTDRPMPNKPAVSPPVRTAPAPAIEIQLLELLLGDPSLLPKAIVNIQPDEITHPGLKRLLACLYQLHRENKPADEDGLRQFIDNPALIDRAMRMQDVGRQLNERQLWLDRVIAAFAQNKRTIETRSIQEQLHAETDHDSAKRLLVSLQAKGNPTAGSDAAAGPVSAPNPL